MLISDWSSDVCSSDLLDSAIMRPDAIIAAALLPHVEHDHDTLRPDRHRHLRDQLGIADSRGADRNLLHAKADDRLRLPGGLHPPAVADGHPGFSRQLDRKSTRLNSSH